MQIFYSSNNLKSERVFLNAEESHHCIKVLRLKNGDKISVIDGVGNFAETEILSADHKSCELKILSLKENFKKRNYYLHIAIAPTKNIDRIEWFVEKAVEFGIDEISFLLCQRSERKNINIERINKIALSATKQSIKAYLPKVNQLIKLTDFLKQEFDARKFIAYCEEDNKEHFVNIIDKNQNVLVLIGPEGDFSNEEIALAKAKGFLPVSLGENRLRTETAGIAVSHIVALKNE